MLEFHSKVLEQARGNISNAQQKQKEHYDKKHAGTSSIAVGSLALLANAKNKQRKGGKQDPLWLGPYIVENISDKGVCTLRNKETGNTLKQQYNVSLLTLFKEKQSQSSCDKKRPLDQKDCEVSCPYYIHFVNSFISIH